MSSTQENINELQKEIENKQVELDNLKKLLELYPNLKKHINRWGYVKYYSKNVNSICDNYDLGHNCGCCEDSPLELWLYKETEYGKVYSDPIGIMIGEKDPYYRCDKPYEGWEKELRGYNITESIINKVSKTFEKYKHRFEDDDFDPDDDWDEDDE